MTAAAKTRERRIVLPVAGMHCASCVAKVEGALSAISGVLEVSVDLPSRTAGIAGSAEDLDPRGRDELENAGVRSAICT